MIETNQKLVPGKSTSSQLSNTFYGNVTNANGPYIDPFLASAIN